MKHRVGSLDYGRSQRTISWEDALEAFLTFKQAQGLRPRSIADYRETITQFFKTYPDVWASDCKPSLLRWLAEAKSPATYSLRFINLRAIFKWCMGQGWVKNNPLDGLSRRRAPGKARLIEIDSLRLLLRQPNPKTFVGLRDYSLILLTLDTGMRPGEALSLLPIDVNMTSREAHIRPEIAKTGLPRTLPFSPSTAQSLARLLAVRHPLWEDDAPVFCSQDGNALRVNSWYQRIKKYSDNCSLNLKPYDLRHAFATIFL